MDGSTATYYTGGCVSGCTEAGASNYDPAAVIDDGSCEYNCALSTLVIDITADTFADENAWTLTEDGVEISSGNGEDQSVTICIDPTLCYLFTMTDAFGDGQTDGSTIITLDDSVIAVTPDSSNPWTSSTTIDIGECGVLGCTDEEACNYDSNATTDNNTCEYAEIAEDCDGNCLPESVTATISITPDLW